MYAQEFSIFTQAGFKARAVGQPVQRSMLPDFLASDCSTPFCTPVDSPVEVKLLGTFSPTHGYSAGRNVHCWSVRLASGLLVPAYSLGAEFNICQATQFLCRRG